MKIKFGDLENAVMFASCGDWCQTGAMVNRESGEIYYFSDEEGMRDPLPEDAYTDKYISLPSERDLGIGREQIFSFSKENAKVDFEKVRNMFNRRGAFGNFKDYVFDLGVIDEWYEYENNEKKRLILEWCEENGIAIEE